ncbi:unnamed protein product [Pleuronectes platessa]|uniref:Uncharacterized protein n=1 Tax=Pleuronectes platessa TaxID=8262 RepID=A0A9N7YJW2_PLEPL|nr:unnamed protein product [Pleuronectes platessa]
MRSDLLRSTWRPARRRQLRDLWSRSSTECPRCMQTAETRYVDVFRGDDVDDDLTGETVPTVPGCHGGARDGSRYQPGPVGQPPHRRVTFSTANQAQDLQDASQHSYYDSGLEESETPSSKSSSGPRSGPLALPEDHFERTTPDGSIGEMEHPENAHRSYVCHL